MSDRIQIIAMRLRDLRDISGMSAEEVAEKSGVDAQVYREYESGTRDFSFSHLFNIAETLGVDISDLLTGESPRLRGYELTRKGKGLEFSLGYSHTITVNAPEGITFEVPNQNELFVSGMDKQLVGQVAANIRKLRAPEPYKGKGIKYEDEHILRKAGKAGK